MSIESDRNRVSQLKKAKVQIEASLGRERENVRRKNAEINSISRSINKNTLLSSRPL